MLTITKNCDSKHLGYLQNLYVDRKDEITRESHVSWKQVCSPKNQCGVNSISLRECNRANNACDKQMFLDHEGNSKAKKLGTSNTNMEDPTIKHNVQNQRSLSWH